MLFLGLSTYGLLLTAQSTPRFQMPLYFEDAVGNRDTIVVGYDANGSFDTLNPQFGEYAISTPFDSIFEVRAAHAIDPPHTLSKKIISHYEGGGGDTCFASAGVEIFIQAKYLPITISYDTTLVNSSFCHRNMILSPDMYIFLFQYWWDAREYYCMSHTAMVVDTFTHPGVTTGGWLSRSFEVEGQGLKELPGYYWVVKYIGICQNQVSTAAPVGERPALTLAPNPANDVLQVNWPTPFSGQLEVVSATGGRGVLHQSVRQSVSTEISVAQLPAGLYFLSVSGADGQRGGQPFVVMH